MSYSAIISECGTYRHSLEFDLEGNGPVASVFMVNPSKADGVVKDATIRKLFGFGERLNWSKVIVGNAHDYRATDINELKTAEQPISPLNSTYIAMIMARSDVSVAAWGSLSKLPPHLRNSWRVIADVARSMNRPLMCWGTCADGHPLHPVMIGYDNKLVQWSASNG